jgi:cytochrome oxidase Cu insertion factor (SCO1/SenC/PrrC family)
MHRSFSLFGTLLTFLALAAAPASAQSVRWGKGYLPNVPVVTQHGESLQFYDDVLKGKIAVISFIYTSCRDICPVVTARLSQLEERLGDAVGREIFFVSISIDPVNDTPAKLKEYSKTFQTGPSWLFLTGKPSDIAVIRHKLGERSSQITEHRNEVLLFNDATAEWERGSIFGDINTLTATVRAMDPAWRDQIGTAKNIETASANSGKSVSLGDAIGLPGQALFIKTCAACHSIGRGEKVGPDLVGLASRRTRAWIASYITAPDKMRSEGDPIALEMVAKYRAVRMPNLGLSEHDASDVMAYLEAQTYAVEAGKRSPQAHHHH